MRWLDRVRVSLRHVRGRLVESMLVIAATAVGVALVAAMVAFTGAYGDQTEALLNHPAYRELIVEVVGNETELAEPAVTYDAQTTRAIDLGAGDLDAAAEATPAVAYAYIADATRFSTTLPGARFARGFGGDPASVRPNGAAPPPDSAALPPGSAAPPPDSAAPSPESAAPAGRPEGGGTGGTGGPGGGRGEDFDLEQFFAADPDVITDLPLESFTGALVTSEFFDAYGLRAADGSLFTSEDVEGGNQVVVLGAGLADTLFGDDDPIGLKVRLNLQTLTIVGVLEPSGLRDVESGTALDEVAFAPNGEARISFGGRTVEFRRPTRTLRFAVSDSQLTETAERQLQSYFDAEYGEGAVRVTAPVERVATEREKQIRVLAVVLFLAAAALFIASINLFNLMLMRVIKRTKSVGISRAIGASRREIFRAFLNESGMMSLFGAAIGLAASPVVYSMLRESLVTDVGPTSVGNWVYLAIGATAALAFSLVFGVWPARQAANIDASLAIRTE